MCGRNNAFELVPLRDPLEEAVSRGQSRGGVPLVKIDEDEKS